MKKTSKLSMFTLIAVLILFLFMGAGILKAWKTSTVYLYPACPQAAAYTGYEPPLQSIIHTADGLELQTWFYPSKNGATIIALTGLGGSLTQTLPDLEFLLDEGYGLVFVESRACAKEGAKVSLGYREGEDVGKILDNPLLAGQQIGIYGFSIGAVASIRAGVLYPQIQAIIAEGNYANLGDNLAGPQKDWWKHPYKYAIAGAFWLRSGINPWQVSPKDEISALSPRPIFLIYGENETESGNSELVYEAALQPKELWIVPGGSHGTNHEVAPEDYQQRVLGFFNQYLLAPLK